MQLFVLQRENKIKNTSYTFTNILTGSGLIQMVHIKCTSAKVQVHKCKSESAPSNGSLHCGFKVLSVKGLKTANRSKALCSP